MLSGAEDSGWLEVWFNRRNVTSILGPYYGHFTCVLICFFTRILVPYYYRCFMMFFVCMHVSMYVCVHVCMHVCIMYVRVCIMLVIIRILAK